MDPFTSMNALINPFSAGIGDGMQGGSQSNPANSGFHGGAPSFGFGPIGDTAMSWAMKKFLNIDPSEMKTPRGAMSDYQMQSMQQRSRVSGGKIGGILGGNPLNKMFGDLGSSSLFQSAVTDGLSGGSRTGAFNQAMGRFGTIMAEPGLGGIEGASRGAENVIRNLDNNFTDKKTGFWDYNKTSGFNRKNTLTSVAEYSKAFGGDGVIKTMAQGETPGNKTEIEGASKKIEEITGVVREAGNLFGSNMPIDKLMGELKKMTSNKGKMSAGDLKGKLQDIQAMAVVVDMSNEAFLNFTKAVGEINAAAGSKASTVDSSLSAMSLGKAMEDRGRADAESQGKVYSGPSAIEAGLSEAKIQAGRESSVNAKMAKSLFADMGALGLSEDTMKEVGQSVADGDYEAVQAKVKALKASGKISQSQANLLETNAVKSANGDIGIDEGAIQDKLKSYGIQADAKKQFTNSRKSTMQEAIDGTFVGQKEELFKGIGKDRLIRELSSGEAGIDDTNVTDRSAMAQQLAERYGIGKEQALDLASTLQQSLRGVSKDDTDLKTFMSASNQNVLGNLDKNASNQAKIKEQIQSASNTSAVDFGDMGITEMAAKTGVETLNQLKEKNGKMPSFKEFQEALSANGQANLLGSSEKSKLFYEGMAGNEKVSESMQKRLGNIKNSEGDKIKETKDGVVQFADGTSDEDKKRINKRVEEERIAANKEVHGSKSVTAAFLERKAKKQVEIEKEIKEKGSVKDPKAQESIAKTRMEKWEKEEIEKMSKEDKDEIKKEGTEHKDDKENDKAPPELMKLIEQIITLLQGLLTNGPKGASYSPDTPLPGSNVVNSISQTA